MPRKPDPYLIDDENPEWTAEDFALARPAKEVLPKSFFDTLAKRKRRRASAPKMPGRIAKA